MWGCGSRFYRFNLQENTLEGNSDWKPLHFIEIKVWKSAKKVEKLNFKVMEEWP